jgi:lipopolysaccharide/colanic/teichoic acid biosynthesis glycosyltransferase
VLRPREFESEALFLKRLFDIVVSAVLLLLVAPLFLMIALAIKLTTPRLPVFYPWRVVGQQGRIFTGDKFTAMDADLDPRTNMSLVGPRPAFPHELERYEFWHKRKLSVRPGLTCLWQIRGRNKISNFDDWVRMDLEYIENWSFWLDIRILARTAWVVIAGTGS